MFLNLVEYKKKKKFSLGDKIIASVAVLAMAVSSTTIGAQAAISLNPVPDSNLTMREPIVSEPVNGDTSLVGSLIPIPDSNSQTEPRGPIDINVPDSATIFIPTPATYCGDDIKNDVEECDGADFGGKTCQSLSYRGGNLKCLNNCLIDSSNCTNNNVCLDDDGGFKVFTKGTTKGPDWFGTFYKESTDECSADSDGHIIVIEYYCDDGLVVSTSIVCPGACEDGACLK